VKLSTDGILTPHVGSLPRPASILPLLQAQSAGQPFDQDALIRETGKAVRSIARTPLELWLSSGRKRDLVRLS